jgi:hypothetical protein
MVFGILAALTLLMFPLAMATDICHEGSTDKICELSPAGEWALVLIPWMCVIAGVVTALAGAGLALRLNWTPLIGLPVGIAGCFATIPVGYVIAFHV